MTIATNFNIKHADEASPSTLARTPFLAWLLAVGPVEWDLVTTAPRLCAEFWFQTAALLACPAYFGVTVGNVALSLFEYPWWAALGLAALSMTGVFLVDWHYLVQRRGTPENATGGVNKVRYATLVVLSISSSLMATHSFKRDIDGVLTNERATRRMELEQSPRYRLRLEGARAAVARLEMAAKRADELPSTVAELEVQHAAAEEGHRNECEGNTTGNHVRVAKCGAIARGFDAEANRLDQQIKTTNNQLAQAQTLVAQLPAARETLAAIETELDKDSALAASGPLKRLEVLFGLIAADPLAGILVLFWVALGLILDLPIWVAQGRSFNHPLLVQARSLENQMLEARIAQLRSEWRRNFSASMAPLEVRLAVKPVCARTPSRAPVMEGVE